MEMSNNTCRKWSTSFSSTLLSSNSLSAISSSSSSSASASSLLETKLDRNAMDIVLSYFTLVDYSNLSVASKTMRNIVSKSSHLYMNGYELFRRRRNISASASSAAAKQENDDNESVVDIDIYITDDVAVTKTTDLDDVQELSVVPSTSFSPQPELQQLMTRFNLYMDENGLFRRRNTSAAGRESDDDESVVDVDVTDDVAVTRTAINLNSAQESLVVPSTISISPQQELKQLMNRFNNLNVLNLQGLAVIGDDLIDILNGCSSAWTLKSITLHSCSLSNCCSQKYFQLPNLQSLTLTGNSIRAKIPFLLKNSNKLKSLTLKQCPALIDEDIIEIGIILKNTLEELVLNHTTKISCPIVSLPRLIRANFAGCFGLTQLSGFVGCPNMKELNLSFCIRLTGNLIENLVEQLPVLETLVIMKCSGVQSLDLKSNKLLRLDASFMHNLQYLRLVCPALKYLDTTCCSSLQRLSLEEAYSIPSLDLSGSLRLKDLTLKQARSLTRLNLQGCRGLNLCQIDCPNLQHVNLIGCRSVALRYCKNVREALQNQKSSWVTD